MSGKLPKLDIDKVKANGWKVGTVGEFLELTPEDEAAIELKLVLSRILKERRKASMLTQEAFAKKVRSSQSRVAKMEAGDASVSLDLLITCLFATGVDVKNLGKMIAEA